MNNQTPIDVTTTDVKQAEVVYSTAGVVVLRDLETKELKKFTVEELKSRNVVVVMGDKEVDPSHLKKGDKLTFKVWDKKDPNVSGQIEVVLD